MGPGRQLGDGGTVTDQAGTAEPSAAARDRRTRVIVGAALVRDGRLLAASRSYPAHLVGLWELPGGKLEPGETEPAAVIRECREELGVDVVVGDRVPGEWPIPGGGVLHAWWAELVDPAAVPHPHVHADLRWLGAEELFSVTWLEPDVPLVIQIGEHLAATPETVPGV